MNTSTTHPCACLSCGEDLEQVGEISIQGSTTKERDPEGKARMDIFIQCTACDRSMYAFIPMDEVFLQQEFPADGCEEGAPA
jgi:hypothetical protein